MIGPTQSAPWRGATTPEVVIQRIADYRSEDKADPKYYADHTVARARAQLEQERQNTSESNCLESPTVTRRLRA